MPALAKPRHEAFARAIVAGLVNGDRSTFSQGRAYIAAGYTAKDAGKSGGSAEVCASKLLKKVKPIADRIRELQQEANARLQLKLDLSRERIGQRLDLASRMAEEQKNPANIVRSELGIAKVFHRIDTPEDESQDFNAAQSMQDIGRKLLQSVGFSSPDDLSIAAAIEANDAFIARLEAIRDQAQATIEQR